MNHEKSVAIRRRLALAREARRDRGEIAANAIEAALANLTLPSGHQSTFDRRHQLTWYRGEPGSNLCWTARKAPSQTSLIDPVDVEVRVFLDEPRCVVWLEQHRPGGRVSLLGRNAVWLYAETYEALLLKAAAVLAAPLNALLAPVTLRQAS